MPSLADIQALYTRRKASYVRYVQAFGHRQGLAAVIAASDGLTAGLRALDAGCGSGLSILALDDALRRRGMAYHSIQGFDVTSAMLDRCRSTLEAHALAGIELMHADVLHLAEQLPQSWTGYDLIICASMLEYISPESLADSLASLADRLAADGRLLAVITRKSFYPTRWLWHCAGYTRGELLAACERANLRHVRFRSYPPAFAWLNVGSHVIEAGR
ncbi:MAG: class I SAM-dependent methyltransferase [Actinobacteria bacterium]|nr:class I SAM-dependent methyltransferase [Actinomycetota bacterium]